MNDANDEKSADDLFGEASGDSRFESEVSRDGGDDRPALDNAVADALEAIDDGDASNHLTVRDDELAALLAALQESDELDSVLASLINDLDWPESVEGTPSDVIRLAMRLGLKTAVPEIVERARDGRDAFVVEKETGRF